MARKAAKEAFDKGIGKVLKEFERRHPELFPPKRGGKGESKSREKEEFCTMVWEVTEKSSEAAMKKTLAECVKLK